MLSNKAKGRLAVVADLLQIGGSLQPFMIFLSTAIGGITSRVPFVSAFGLAGIIWTALIAYLFISACAALQRKFKKPRTALQESRLGRFQEIISWRGWNGIISLGCLVLTFYFIEFRPQLPSGISPSSLALPVASYREMSQSRIAGKSIVVSALLNKSHPMEISGKHFEKCEIIGPAVLCPISNVSFIAPEFETPIELDNILFQIKDSISTNCGVIIVMDCEFMQCTFKAISFVGNAESLDTLRKSITFKR